MAALTEKTILPFLESTTDDTPVIGSFNHADDMNSIDAAFEKAVDMLGSKGINYFTDITRLVRQDQGEAIMEAFKENVLAPLKEACAEHAAEPEKWGNHVNTYDIVSAMWDNSTKDFLKESASVGVLRPIKALDYPVIVKEQVGMVASDIIPTKVVPTPDIKRHIEQTWIIDNVTKKRWKYPQCFYNGEYDEIYKAGVGLPIKDTPVALPCFDYDIISNLTDSTTPARDEFTIRLKIIKAITVDGDEIPMDMYVSLETHQWQGGKIDTVIKKAGQADKPVKDYLTGAVDYVSKTVSVSSASGQIAKVVFGGRLSNELNERHVSMDYTREPVEFLIEDGHRVFVPYSIEQLDDYNALLKVDLYKKTYNHISEYMSNMEDSEELKYLDEEFMFAEGLDLDPLDWNGFVRYMDFNCDSTTKTTALPSEYITTELKFKIDRFINDLSDLAKMEDLTFNIFGNNKYTSLLGDGVKWTFRSGSSNNGIKNNHSYGAVNTGNVSCKIVSAMKFDARSKLHNGLRFIPISTRNDRMTFEHYKYTTHVLTPADANYRAPDRPGGEKTSICGLSRYTTEKIQGIQGMMTFSNDEFISSSMTRFDPTLNP